MQIVLFKKIQFSMSTQFMSKNFLFQFIQTDLIWLIQLSISTDFVNT